MTNFSPSNSCILDGRFFFFFLILSLFQSPPVIGCSQTVATRERIGTKNNSINN